MQRTLGDLQNAMASFRSAHPAVMRLSGSWTSALRTSLYGKDDDPLTTDIIHYYSYIDIGLEFCNTTLAAAQAKRLSKEVLEGHYRPLVRHFLAENYPFIASSLPGPYLSTYIREELKAAVQEGWNWDQRHQELRQFAS